MRRPLALAILLPALMSCGSVLEPADVLGDFALQDTPVVIQAGDGRLEIIADTLRVGTNGTASRHVTESFQSPAGSWVTERVEPYRYTIRGGIVEFEYVCPPNALMLCSPPPHFWGTPIGTGLSLRSAMDPQVRLHYKRVASDPAGY